MLQYNFVSYFFNTIWNSRDTWWYEIAQSFSKIAIIYIQLIYDCVCCAEMKTIFIIELMLWLVSPFLHVPIKTVEFINTTEAVCLDLTKYGADRKYVAG